jgi:hypothetical protein
MRVFVHELRNLSVLDRENNALPRFCRLADHGSIAQIPLPWRAHAVHEGRSSARYKPLNLI